MKIIPLIFFNPHCKKMNEEWAYNELFRMRQDFFQKM